MSLPPIFSPPPPRLARSVEPGAVVESYRRLRVTVVDSAGRPKAGAIIEVMAIDDSEIRISGSQVPWYKAAVAKTDRDGRATLAVPATDLYVLATADPLVGVVSVDRYESDEVTLALHQPITITGTVIGINREPIEGALVRPSTDCRERHTPRELGYIRSDLRMLSVNVDRAIQVTDRDGKFEFRLRREGLICVIASSPRHLVGTSDEVQVLAGGHMDFTVPLVSGVWVRGQVVDPRRRPVAGARVEVVATLMPREIGYHGEGIWGASATTLSDGRFEITVPPGTLYKVVATHPAYGDAEVALPRWEWGEQTLVLAPSGQVKVQIVASVRLQEALREVREARVAVGADERKDVEVVVEDEPDETYEYVHLNLDQEGRAETVIGGLEPGWYRVVARAGGFVAHSRPFRVPLRDDRPLQLRLGKSAGEVEGVMRGLPAAVDRGGFVLASDQVREFSTRLQPDGSFRFPALPPGQWTLSLSGASGAPSELGSLLAGRETAVALYDETTAVTIAGTLVPAPPGGDPEDDLARPKLALGAYSGRVLIYSAPGTALREGDELLAIDGVRVIDVTSAAKLLLGPPGTKCHLRRLRPATGEILELALPRVKQS